jgi:hypothetical protein
MNKIEIGKQKISTMVHEVDLWLPGFAQVNVFTIFRLSISLFTMKRIFSLLPFLALFNTYGQSPERLVVSRTNPHLLETVSGKPVFLNSYTLWYLLRNGSREDIREMVAFCKENKFNMIAIMILDFDNNPLDAGRSFYGSSAFSKDDKGLPDPLKPLITEGNDPGKAGEYDFWDHLDYVIELTAKNGMYIGLHPAWGDWFSGKYSGERPGDPVIFNPENAYKYGNWLGKRYRDKDHIIWMAGGDRSAIYELKTDGSTQVKDYRQQYRALTEGLADGKNGIDKQDGEADYSNVLISFHPRKWAPNSSEWFHNDRWLAFNSIQDTPADQVFSVPHDYSLEPVKPTWLYEGRYEGSISTWGVRYQAYQTVLSGGAGHNYGGEKIWQFPSDWRDQVQRPGSLQMKYLYHVAKEIWTDREYLHRMPDSLLVRGSRGITLGDGMFQGGASGKRVNTATSDRITAMRSDDGEWAMIYTSDGRDIDMDLSRRFNPRNGKWWSAGKESGKMIPAKRNVRTGEGSYVFDPPGSAGPDNDWVLILR